jgi:hypothetical protein
VGRILRNELAGAQQTPTGLALDSVVATTVGLQGRGAVRAHDLEVLEPVVGRDPVDVIEDQRHGLSAPLLSLPAQPALSAFHALAEQAPLQGSAVVVRVDDENLIEGSAFGRPRIAPRPVRIKVPGLDPMALDQVPERLEVSSGRAKTKRPESLGQAARRRDRIAHLFLGVVKSPRHTRTLVRAPDGIALFAGNSYLQALS